MGGVPLLARQSPLVFRTLFQFLKSFLQHFDHGVEPRLQGIHFRRRVVARDIPRALVREFELPFNSLSSRPGRVIPASKFPLRPFDGESELRLFQVQQSEYGAHQLMPLDRLGFGDCRLRWRLHAIAQDCRSAPPDPATTTASDAASLLPDAARQLLWQWKQSRPCIQ